MDGLADQLLGRADAESAQLLGPDGLLTQLTQRVLDRALDAELAEHLGYEKGDPGGRGSGNNRNGTTAKKVLTDIGAVEVNTPRDRNGSFEPRIVPKHARRLAGFNEQILSLYARGMSVRDIRSHLQQMYGVEVSGDVISRVTDAVTEKITIWQNRPLDPVWPIVYIDALWIKIRDGAVSNRPVYLAVGVDLDGRKHVLGLWIGPADSGEGARFWASVLAELRNRGRWTIPGADAGAAADGGARIDHCVARGQLGRSGLPCRRDPADRSWSRHSGRVVTLRGVGSALRRHRRRPAPVTRSITHSAQRLGPGCRPRSATRPVTGTQLPEGRVWAGAVRSVLASVR
nr:IS256 family transposase [Nocardia sp. BMG51109]